MTIRTNMRRPWLVSLLASIAMLTATSGAFAQNHGGGGGFGGGGFGHSGGDGHFGGGGNFGGDGHSDGHFAAPAHQHFDNRFAHNQVYFDRGYRVRDRPFGGYAIDHGRDHYWYDRGQWYRHGGFGWVVVGAPIGAFVTVLPPYYSTVWFGGVPYYYADDTYYDWSAAQREYQVVEPPAGIDSAGTTQPPASDKIFIYPKNGQSSQQQASDQYACYRSAVDQTGYDPTQAGGGVSPEAAAGKRVNYFRADAACLDARGYSVQ